MSGDTELVESNDECGIYTRVRSAIDRGIAHVLESQLPDGRWEGFNDAGPYFLALAIILERYLDVDETPSRAEREAALRRCLLADGGVPQWVGDTYGQVDATAMWLGAARCLGMTDTDADVQRARAFVEKHGGWSQTEWLSRVFLAVAGVLPRSSLPTIPLVHSLVPFHSQILAKLIGVNLLFPSYLIPAVVSAVRRGGPPRTTIEKAAAERAIEYLTERQDDSGGWMGLSFYTLLAATALVSLGIARDDGRIVAAVSFARRSWRHDERGWRFSPFYSTLWDTSQMVRALRSVGVPAQHPAIQRAAKFLLRYQCRMPSPWDWQTPPLGAPAIGGWPFQPGNERNPDLDSTQEVLGALALAAEGASPEHPIHAAIDAGARWLVAMQNRDGGWAAFSWGKPSQLAGPAYLRGSLLPNGGGWIGALVRVGLRGADALVQLGDPSTADVAGRTLETLALLGYQRTDDVVERAISFIREQRYSGNGVWWGRWAVNFVPTTSYIVCGLCRAGVDPSDAMIRYATSWMLRLQHSDGGWGDCPESYSDPWRAGDGPSMASITGFVLKALCVVGRGHANESKRAVEFLLEQQRTDGSWDDPRSQGVMIPNWLYYHNNTFSTFVALDALGEFMRAQGNEMRNS